MQSYILSLVHLADESIDVLLSVAEVTTLNEVVALLVETTSRVAQLEGPQELVGLLFVLKIKLATRFRRKMNQ